MRRFLPKSLLGQMLLSVALALLVAQAISAVLQYREADRRREMVALNGLAFQLASEPRFDFRQSKKGNEGRVLWRRLRVQRADAQPLLPGEHREPSREDGLRAILSDQGINPTDADRAIIGAGVGATAAHVGGHNAIKGVAIGAAAGALCDDVRLCQ